MKIVVLDIAASKTGAMSVLRDFYSYVSENDVSGNEWIFITGTADALPLEKRGNISVILRDDVKASSKNRLIFEFITGGAFVNRLAPDVVLSLENTLPHRMDKHIRTFLYIHQPSGFQKIKKFSLFKRDERHVATYQHFYHKLILDSAKQADASIVQTEWMREALIRDTGLAFERVKKIAPDIPDLSGFVKPGLFEPDRFIYPASDLPYKNHAVIEEARAILAGKGYYPKVMYTKDKNIPRDELFAEYNRSTLLFPSYIETFGMPLAEAKQFGNPVIAADTEFAREVLGSYENAHFFDAFDAGALAILMKKVMDKEIGCGKPMKNIGSANSYAQLVDLVLYR
ncbi:MAG: glycosyltransferase [Lachnospiraceae bacterium]|nr:glycosyltransferase [Lachnospiraceae bacterium]